MDIALITGSNGLIGGAASAFFHDKGFTVIGIDNDMRAYFFGPTASTKNNLHSLTEHLPRYKHYNYDIRDNAQIDNLFAEYGKDIKVVIHTAAQPSHDWAVKEPFTDFTINANGTLNLLEATRKHCPNAVFIFTSTNKVYGDGPNKLPLIEQELRWEVDPKHGFAEHGIDEAMSIDNSMHCLFGVSKTSADLMVQEYGKYFGMNTVAFRGGCLTGPSHAGTELHGFLSYLIKCAVQNKPYTILGYKGKQVRDNIHSNDLVNAFWHVYQAPRKGEVYNMGGSRHSNTSILEAIATIKKLSGISLNYTISDKARIGDHIWYVSDVRKFQSHYPNWQYAYNNEMIIKEMLEKASKTA